MKSYSNDTHTMDATIERDDKEIDIVVHYGFIPEQREITHMPAEFCQPGFPAEWEFHKATFDGNEIELSEDEIDDIEDYFWTFKDDF